MVLRCRLNPAVSETAATGGNNGAWYNFGYLFGLACFFGGGGHGARRGGGKVNLVGLTDEMVPELLTAPWPSNGSFIGSEPGGSTDQ